MKEKRNFTATALEMLKSGEHIGYAPICKRKGMKPKGYLDDDGNPIVFKTAKEAKEWVLLKESLPKEPPMGPRDYMSSHPVGQNICYWMLVEFDEPRIKLACNSMKEYAEYYHKEKLKEI